MATPGLFPRILERMRELVRTGRYVMTIHALDAMEDDELTVFDVERCFLTGRIVERNVIVLDVSGSISWRAG